MMHLTGLGRCNWLDSMMELAMLTFGDDTVRLLRGLDTGPPKPVVC